MHQRGMCLGWLFLVVLDSIQIRSGLVKKKTPSPGEAKGFLNGSAPRGSVDHVLVSRQHPGIA